VPPLRERREDIIPLARQVLRAAAQKFSADPPPLTPEAERALLEYDFPGNIRELQNVMERAVVLQRSEGGPLELSLVRRSGRPSAPPPSPAAVSHAELASESGPHVIPIAHFRELEKKNIVAALERCAWKIAGDQGAARLLGMKPSTLAYQMKTLGIERSALRNP